MTTMKLNKAQTKRLSAAQDKASAAHEALSDAITAYNDATQAAFAALRQAVEAYEEVRSDLSEEIQGIGSALREVFDAKSEKWQESEAGETAGTWISEFEDCDLEEFSPDEPDELIEPDELTDVLNGLNTESD